MTRGRQSLVVGWSATVAAVFVLAPVVAIAEEEVDADNETTGYTPADNTPASTLGQSDGKHEKPSCCREPAYHVADAKKTRQVHSWGLL